MSKTIEQQTCLYHSLTQPLQILREKSQIQVYKVCVISPQKTDTAAMGASFWNIY